VKGKILIKGKKIPIKKSVLKNIIRDYIHLKGFFADTLLFSFLSDAELLNINQKFLRHNHYTDIITFDYSKDKFLLGEIYISLDRVKENALNYATTYEDEILRVIAHGILHLMGYKDKTSKEKRLMRKEEDLAISFFKSKLFHVEH
jgi:rRNA maturation RNase YbeY